MIWLHLQAFCSGGLDVNVICLSSSFLIMPCRTPAFVIMQSKSTFLEFLDGYLSLQICPFPLPEKLFRAVASFLFYRPRFNAYTHAETENSPIVQIERSRIKCEVLATHPLEKTSPQTKTETQY